MVTGPASAVRAGNGVARHYRAHGQIKRRRLHCQTTYCGLNISQAAACWEGRRLGEGDFRHGDNVGAVGEESPDLAQSGHLVHDLLEFRDHGGVVGWKAGQYTGQGRGNSSLLMKDCHSQAVRASRARRKSEVRRNSPGMGERDWPRLVPFPGVMLPLRRV